MRRLVGALRRRIAAKLALTLVGFVAVAVLAAALYVSRALEAFAVEGLAGRLESVARVLEDEARGLLEGPASPDRIHAFVARTARTAGARVTLIAADGRVLGESELPLEALGAIENHAARPEVQAALAGRVGRDVRRSATVGAPLLYVAVPVARDGRPLGVLRLALPLDVVAAARAALGRVPLAGSLLALVIAAVIGVVVARRITRPVREMRAIAARMSEGDFAARVPVRSSDELGALGQALNLMAARLRERLDELHRQETTMTAILDGMVEAVVAVDAAARVLFVNERARRLLALHGVPVEGRPFLELVRSAELHQLLAEGRAGLARRELRLPGPGAPVVEARAVPLRRPGAAPGVVLVLHDVTELRRLERVRTEFIANVSHELRTPLTAIRAALETLLSGDAPESAKPFLEVAFRHTERMSRLLDELTDLSNLELGRVRLALEPVPVEEAVDSVLVMIQPQAEARGVTVTAEIAPGLRPVRADRDRLEQILMNLVDNAVKYTAAGGQVTVAARPGAGGRVALLVVDTGVGIPPADLPRVTERFYRVDRARSREGGGSGLGLAIVKHLVAAHGGVLHLESAPGRGTTVRVELPAA